MPNTRLTPEQLKELTVLCVDDEPNVLSSLKRLLRQEPFKLLTAQSGEQGLDMIRENPVHLVISDQRMPSMAGTEFLKHVKNLAPDAVRVVLSGYADAGVILEAINQGEIYRFLTKPWDDEELKLAIRQCLSHYTLMMENQQKLSLMQTENRTLACENETLRQALQSQQETVSLLQSGVHQMVVPFALVNPSGRILMGNQAFFELFAPATTPPIVEDVTYDVFERIEHTQHGILQSEKLILQQFLYQTLRNWGIARESQLYFGAGWDNNDDLAQTIELEVDGATITVQLAPVLTTVPKISGTGTETHTYEYAGLLTFHGVFESGPVPTTLLLSEQNWDSQSSTACINSPFTSSKALYANVLPGIPNRHASGHPTSTVSPRGSIQSPAVKNLAYGEQEGGR